MTSLSETAAELIRTDPALANEVARQLSAAVTVGLTRRQASALTFMRSYFAEHGVMPSYAETREALGLASSSGVSQVIAGLVERGHIKRLPGRARAITFVRGPA